MNKRTHWYVASAALVFVSNLGCEPAKPPAPVEGVVTLDGKPLAKAGVSLVAANVAPGRSAGLYTGMTDEQGKYTLRSALDGGESLPPGTYKVTITTAISSGTDYSATPPEELVPEKYRDGALTIEIPEGGKKDANFALESD